MTGNNHAEDIDEQYRTGKVQERESLSKKQRMARAIQSFLAAAESAASRGDEVARDEALAKATGLQLKYAIDDAMLASGVRDKDQLATEDFCTESNTPLIKAKRQLINGLAKWNRGKAVMMGEWKEKRGGGQRYDKRAKVRVYAHESDLRFITMLYNSLILQMQTMMAADEERDRRYGRSGITPLGGWAGWRVSYAYGWVERVIGRIAEAAHRNEGEAETSQPGTALVLRDRTQLVQDHVTQLFGQLRTTRYRRDDHDPRGRQAGRVAAERADLGGTKVGSAERPRLQA